MKLGGLVQTEAQRTLPAAPTFTQTHQQFNTSSALTLPRAGLWVPAVDRLVPRLLYLYLKGAAPRSADFRVRAGMGRAGPLGLKGCGCHAVDVFCCRLGGEEEEELMLGCVGDRGRKK